MTSREPEGTGQKRTRLKVNRSEETAEKRPEPGARVRNGRKGKNLAAGGPSRTKRSNQLAKEEPIPSSEVTCRRRNYKKMSCRTENEDATHARKNQEKKQWPQEANPSRDRRGSQEPGDSADQSGSRFRQKTQTQGITRGHCLLRGPFQDRARVFLVKGA